MFKSIERFSARALLCLLLAAGVGLTGCQTTDWKNDPNLTPAQRQLRAETHRFNQTVAEGALAGALAGALIGAIAADDNPLAGAAIGAGAGAVVGAGAGFFVASQNESYASEEARLNAEIEAARQEVASYQRIVSASQQVVNQHRATIDSLNRQYRQGQITAEQYRRQTTGIQGDIESIEAAIDNNQEQTGAMQDRLGELRRQGVNAASLAQAEAQLRAQRQQLEAQLDSLLLAMDSAPVSVG